MPWFKGNMHCHSNHSDGELPPSAVAHYYKELGYDFLGIADHNQCTSSEEWQETGKILGISCCEYTGENCCHVIAIGVDEPIAPNLLEENMWKRCSANEEILLQANDDKFKKTVLILQDGIDKTLAAGGLPVIAHPFWHWTYNFREVMELKNCKHFELCNASPDCNSIPFDGKSHPDMMWDNLLSNNYRIYGMGSDDAHIYIDHYKPRSPLGGRAWNMVKANELNKENIMNALWNGQFYASTGVEVRDYKVFNEGIYITIELVHDERVNIDFIGRNGEVLQSNYSPVAEYRFSGDETYVRVRIASSAGFWAWMQPVFLDDIENPKNWTHQP